MRSWIVAVGMLAAGALMMAACTQTVAPYNGPLPSDGPILYSCDDGTQLTVQLVDGEARVAIVGGRSFTLPSVGADYYSNGRYAFRGGGRQGTWEVGRMAPVNCRGS